VASAAGGLAELTQWSAHVLICDIAMPEMDGYALIAHLRERPDEEGGHLPAIALTAYAREEDRNRALAAGFQEHVSKPVEPAELVSVVKSLASRGS